MKITVLCVGRVKEKFYRDAVAEYAKRLGSYCRFEVREVGDEPTPDKCGPAQADRIRELEARRLLAGISRDAYVCTLEIRGKRYTSEGFADLIGQTGLKGRSHMVFVIGGSLGLHESVTERSDCAVSFSDMTFPHQLMRVILSEQIYRAYRILNGQPYHK